MNEDFTFYLFLIGPPLAGEAVFLLWLFRYSQTHPQSAGWQRLLLFNLLSFLLLIGLAGAGGELYYRYVYDTTDSLAYTKVSRQWMERYCRYNAAGFRDNVEYSLERQPGVRRITFLGDSFTAGHGIKSVEDRFPNLIRAQHAGWEIHVMAKFGLDTGPEVRLLEKAVTNGYQLDYVVLVYCLNDLADMFPAWDAALVEIVSDKNRGGWLRRNSFFIDTIYHRYKAAHDPRLSQYFAFVRDGYRGELWQEQKRRLSALHDYINANGGKLLVVTFPFLQLEGTNYEYQFVHDQLDQFWRGMKVPHLDLQPAFSGQPGKTITVNSHDAHPNERANRIAAEEINRFLMEQIEKKAGAR